MGDSYEAWKECKRRLADEPDSTFLQRVESSLRQAALEDYLESFRGLDGSEEQLTVDEHEAAVFLSGLDELRAPSDAELRAARAVALSEAQVRIRSLLELNWTGDHLYSDAVQDAVTMLASVAEGKPVPKLERFRCPSVYVLPVINVRTRCALQLPHDKEHIAYAVEGMGSITWTDEQSANPPKSYDGPDETCPHGWCSLPAGHSEPHAQEPLPPSAARCPDWLEAGSRRTRCEHELGHAGFHHAVGHGRWS
jgi:hypothetical protein